MTVLLGDTGKVSYGTLKQTSITLPTARETTVSLTLPTTEPGSPQISYTVQSTDVATFSGNVPQSVQNIPLIFACGRIGAAASVISYRILINGASQVQASLASTASGLYYTINFARYIQVNVGDVVTVSLWSSQADTTFVYHAFTTGWTRMQLTKTGVILKDVVYGAGASFPTLSTAPAPISAGSSQTFTITVSTTGTTTTGATAGTFPALVQDATNAMGRQFYGDVNNIVQLNTHATNQTNYVRNFMPPSISFREVLR